MTGPTVATAVQDLDWERLRSAALEKLGVNETKFAHFLDQFATASALSRRLVGEDRSSMLGERPQDHLAVALVIAAFRGTFSGVLIAACGYPEISPSHARASFESALRLVDVERAPVASSLGAALDYTDGVLKTGKAEVGGTAWAERQASWTDLREKILTRAAADGIDEAELRRHGKLNFRDVATFAHARPEYRHLDFENSYRILYSENTGFAHSRHAATFYPALLGSGQMPGEGGVLLPTDAYVFSSVMNSVTHLALLLVMASRVIADEGLTREAEVFLHRLDHLHHHYIEEHGAVLGR
jgi:hypothetical protein